MPARLARRAEPRRLRVTVTDGSGRFTAAAGGLGRWLARAAPVRARGVVSIALVTDRQMRALNREFRGKDHATDVLTFPAAPRTKNREPGTWNREPLGDIAISLGIALRQAREVGHSRAIELRILALHGLLHLLGYDHEADRGQMGKLEERLRRRTGLPAAGLIARIPGRRHAR